MARIVFFGTPDYAVCVPQALKEAGHEIVGVVTQPPRPVGRKQIITQSPIAQWAQENKIKIIDKDPSQISEDIKSLQPETGILAAYGKIIPKEILDPFPHGMLNIHPSLLPKLRGASPIQEGILAGDKTLGITILKMDELVDHGPIVSQTNIDIQKDDTFQSLRTKAFNKGAGLLQQILEDYLNGKIKPKPQDHTKPTFTYKTDKSKQKAYFDIDNPPSPEVLDRMVRAFYPWPVAWTRWSFDAQDKQGKVVKFFPEKKIQIEGKNPVSFAEFKRAYPHFPLSIF